jgi:hypothetical protein
MSEPFIYLHAIFNLALKETEDGMKLDFDSKVKVIFLVLKAKYLFLHLNKMGCSALILV